MAEDQDEQLVRDFMTQNKLIKFADAIIEEGWLLDDLKALSVTEIQEVADSVKMKKGFATRFQKAIEKLKTPQITSQTGMHIIFTSTFCVRP